MSVEAIEPIGDARWSALLAAATDASIFHHPAWLRLLREQYRYEIVASCAFGPDGAPLAGLPLAIVRSRLTGSRLVALPFSDVCPPLLASGAPSEAPEALARGVESLRRLHEIELEVRAPMAALDSAQVVPRFHQHLLALERSADAVEERATPAARRGVAKARREGVTIERLTTPAGLEAFYRLHLQTRKRQGMPTQPKRFIRAFSALFDVGLGFVLLARLGPRPIAAAVFLNHDRTLTYKYGASDARFLNKRPNNLLFAEAIRWGVENGFRTLDLGRTDFDNPGLAAFKRGWGAEERQLAYTYLPRPGDRRERAGSLRGGDAGIAARSLTATITRGPTWLGRLIGEVLYRHVG